MCGQLGLSLMQEEAIETNPEGSLAGLSMDWSDQYDRIASQKLAAYGDDPRDKQVDAFFEALRDLGIPKPYEWCMNQIRIFLPRAVVICHPWQSWEQAIATEISTLSISYKEKGMRLSARLNTLNSHPLARSLLSLHGSDVSRRD